MKKVFKIGCFSVLGLFALLILITILIPTHTKDESKRVKQEVTPAEQMPTVENTPTPIEKPKPPPETKRVYWDKTPAEQGIKVGDWINIEGYTGQMIGAEVIGTGGKIVGWKWHQKKIPSLVTVASQSTGLSAPQDKIVNIMGFIEENTKSREVKRINDEHIEKWHEDEKGYVRITGEISKITPPDDARNRYPRQWGIDLKIGSIYIELVER